MNSRSLARIAVTSISLLAVALPSAAAHAAPKDACWRYQATVNRHQDRIAELDAQIDPVAKKIEQLDHEYQDANGAAEYYATVWGEARDWVGYLEEDESGEFSAADYRDAVAKRDEARKQLDKANAAERKAYAALNGVSQDPKVVEERAKSQKLLVRAENALAKCEAKPSA
ncbi:hypothetical protein [Streptomyces sp. NBC_01465]|uniref:hypothetical protein n=1 Tax=Streptomyces sp. NBC_01465 TaxID=2903878 RepID=UPI002E31002B|nr:hypothetical protein [Streptomyces sp. NBC_01465]